jgi:hypothetical protein
MSRIDQMAPLIRSAVADDYCAQDFYDAVVNDEGAMAALVFRGLDDRDFPQLTATEWLWFANWRQSRGGLLDEELLTYLTLSSTSRSARFQVRALVLRDPETNSNAIEWRPDQPDSPAGTGLKWLERQARLGRIDVVLFFAAAAREQSDLLFDRQAAADAERSWRLQGEELEIERARRARRDADLVQQQERARNQEALELMADALHCGTYASWYLLTRLTSFEGKPYDLVRQGLERYANEHGLEQGWFQKGEPA